MTQCKVSFGVYFLKEQGYGTEHVAIQHDNKSAILLVINGKQSSNKRTKHLKMKYFFVKDKVEDGEIKIEHIPTEKMWVDVLTKPKQGSPFRVDRAEQINCAIYLPDKTLTMQKEDAAPIVALQECVGDQAFFKLLHHMSWNKAVTLSRELKQKKRRTDRGKKNVINKWKMSMAVSK